MEGDAKEVLLPNTKHNSRKNQESSQISKLLKISLLFCIFQVLFTLINFYLYFSTISNKNSSLLLDTYQNSKNYSYPVPDIYLPPGGTVWPQPKQIRQSQDFMSLKYDDFYVQFSEPKIQLAFTSFKGV